MVLTLLKPTEVYTLSLAWLTGLLEDLTAAVNLVSTDSDSLLGMV